MKRLSTLLLAVLTVLTSFTFPAAVTAAEGTVYVNADTGSDSANGTTPDTAFKTLEAAIKALASSGGKIVLTSDISLKGSLTAQYEEPKHTGKIIITSNDGTKNYGTTLRLQDGMVYALNGPTEFSDLKFHTGSGKTVIAARFNPIVMGEGLTFNASNTILLGGYQGPKKGTPVNKNSNVTVKSGKFNFIAGFSRNQGDGNITYTGTAYIKIYGGTVATVYGASTINHFSGNCDIRVYGGTVSALYTGGDVTRRLNGKSNIEIYGGTVSSVNINNAIGDTTIKLDGGNVLSMTESNANSTIADLASAAKRSLTYNSASFTAERINRLAGKIMDSISSYGLAYVKAGSNGSGKTKDDPAGDIDTAIKLIGSGGGKIAVIGEYAISGNYTAPAHTGELKLVAEDAASVLKLENKASFSLSGPMDIALPVSGNEITFLANGNSVKFSEGFTSNGGITVYGASEATQNASIQVYAGDISKIYLTKAEQAAGTTLVADIAGGNIGWLYASEAGKTNGNVSFSLSGGNVDCVDLSGVYGSLSVSAQKGSIKEFICALNGNLNEGAEYSLSYDASNFDGKLFDSASKLFGNISNEKVIFVSGKGGGNGLSVTNPTTLAEAFKILSETGGKIVICEETEIKASLNAAKYSKQITVTSVYKNTDYRKSGAKLILGADILLNGDTVIEELDILLGKSAPAIRFNGNNATIGNNVTVEKPEAFAAYPNVICGKNTPYSSEYTVTVNSGSYNSLYLGSDTASAKITESKASVVINGGEFFGPIYVSGNAPFEGDASFTLNNGTLHAGVYGCGNSADASFNGTLSYNVNGGKIIGKISAAYLSSAKLNGSMNLSLNGGNYSSVTDIIGPDEFNGNMTPNVNISGSVDIFAEETGTASFQNPVKDAGDPWVIYKDGYYYFTRTSGSTIGIAKATNLGDLAHAPLVTVFDPPNGQMYSKNLWSPELHYFSASDFNGEDFTEEDEGWYLILACDDGNNDNHRMYVVKALTDDAQGPYGNPVTGEVNIPQKIVSDTEPEVNSTWTIGQTFAWIKGELYCFWVSEREDETRLYQTMHISKMKNPWTATGKTAIVCEPTEDWEKHGATYNTEGTRYPEVVEGIAITYGPDGEVFMLYCGSGYWTANYCLGQLKLVGEDPINYDSWYKYPEPILTKNNELNGTGHCCYTTSPDGKTKYIIYHAYVGTDQRGGRYMIAEEYSVTKDGVVIGDGSKKPAPLSTVFTAPVNSMPIIKKLKGWGNAVKPFITIKDTACAANAISVSPVLSSGEEYSEAKHGSLEYKYRTNGTLEKYTAGLPTAEGEYQVIATLKGNHNYSGLSAEFVLTLSAPSTAAPDTSAADTTDTPSGDTDSSFPVIPTVIGAAALIVVIAVIMIIKKKKK